MNNEEETEENYYQCLYCGDTFDTEEERDAHTFENHMNAVEQKLREISELAQEHSQTIQEWKDEKRRELLLKISQERPQLLHEIQCSPHGDEILNREVEMELLRKALKTNTLTSFDAMWIKHPKFEEIYRADREKPEHQPQTGQSTGQEEEFFESPDAMIGSTKRTNVKENLTDEDRQKKQMVLVLTALLRKRKQ